MRTRKATAAAQRSESDSSLGDGGKMKRNRDRQVAALPFRIIGSRPEVMLITSRETGRWIIPKGWPQKGRSPHVVAMREAYEEAGLKGRIRKRPVGTFRYQKRLPGEQGVICRVTVFLLEVKQQLDDWPEKRSRKRCWLAPDEAAGRVDEEELCALLSGLTDRLGSLRDG